MEDTQREQRVGRTPENEQSEENRDQETPVLTARLLANPRRVRLN
jgi:hypothetical protein